MLDADDMAAAVTDEDADSESLMEDTCGDPDNVASIADCEADGETEVIGVVVSELEIEIDEIGECVLEPVEAAVAEPATDSETVVVTEGEVLDERSVSQRP